MKKEAASKCFKRLKAIREGVLNCLSMQRIRSRHQRFYFLEGC